MVSRGSYVGVVFPVLVALEVVTLDHCDGTLRLGHVETEVVYPDLVVHREGENLRNKRNIHVRPHVSSHLIAALTVTCIDPHVFIFFAAHCVETEMTGFISHLAQNLVSENET